MAVAPFPLSSSLFILFPFSPFPFPFSPFAFHLSSPDLQTGSGFSSFDGSTGAFD